MKHFILTSPCHRELQKLLRSCINTAMPAQREYGQNNGGGEVENRRNTDWTLPMFLYAAVLFTKPSISKKGPPTNG